MSAICLLSACYCLSARYRQYWHTALLMMMIWSRAWNEGYPKVREDFTITGKDLLGPSPGWKRLLATDNTLYAKQIWNWDTECKGHKGRAGWLITNGYHSVL